MVWDADGMKGFVVHINTMSKRIWDVLEINSFIWFLSFITFFMV